jgi:competence protein ComFC
MGASRSPVYQLYRLIWLSLDLLFPPICAGCGEFGSRWCSECEEKTIKISPPLCDRCGANLVRGRNCRRCEAQSPKFDALRSWALFTGPLRNALHELKYKRNLALGENLARYLIQYLDVLDWSIDMVIPVPLARYRQKERGYNQAALLAKPISLALHYPYKPQGLARVRETSSQIDLSYRQRHENVLGAFQAREKIVKSKNILLVDDVATSGATMNACAAALKESMARTVLCLTIARTP